MRELQPLLESIAVPKEFNDSESTDPSILLKLEQWKRGVEDALGRLVELLNQRPASELTIQDQAAMVAALTPLTPIYELASTEREELQEDWISVRSQGIAEGILSIHSLDIPTPELVIQVLTYQLKPIFQDSPHPRLHAETGRTLPRPAGGPHSGQDLYEGQKWKQHPGISHVVFCHDKAGDYENMWHLLIPPVMTLLDDFEVRHKLQGVMIVQGMLRHVPKELLKRTGVNKLMSTGLRNCLSHLDRLESPRLVKSAISTSVSLILTSTAVVSGRQASSERFNELSALLGEGIIAGIWLYSEDKPQIILATYDGLPQLLRALDIGSVRFLQSLVPQITHALIPQPFLEPDRTMQLAAVNVLRTLMEVCRPRIASWTGTILNAVGRCWASIIDAEGASKHTTDLKGRKQVQAALQDLCSQLVEVDPNAALEYQKLLEFDRSLFEGLIAGTSITTGLASS